MKMKTAALAILVAGLTATGALAQDRIAFGTTNTASSHYAFAVALSQAVEAGDADVQLTLIETGGSVDNVRRLSEGRVGIGITTSEVLYQAANGIGVFEAPVENARTLFLYTAAPMVIAVRADSGVEEIEGLEGKAFNPGLTGSSSEKMSEIIYQTLGIAPDYFRGSVSDALQATQDRRIVGFAKASAGLAPDATLLELQTLTDIKILGFSEDQAGAVLEEYPYYSTLEIPANTYAGQAEPVTTFGFAMAIAIDADVPEETAYRMLKAIVEHKDIQEQAFAGAAEVDYIDFTLNTATIPLHPGAVRYLEEIGREIPEHLRP